MNESKKKVAKLIDFALRFKEEGDFVKAKINLKKVISIDPENHIALNNLGNVYLASNDKKRAKNYFLSAIKIKQNYSSAIFNLALIHEADGEKEETINLYKKAIEFEPHNLGFYYNLFRVEPSYFDSEKIKIIEDILEEKGTSEFDKASGYFILANDKKNKKDYTNEFKNLIDAHNYFFHSKEDVNKKILFYWTNIIPKLFTKFNIKKKTTNKNIKPIFLIGLPRSGSTLIESIICSGKKRIPIGGETGIVNRVFLNENNKIFDKDFLQSDKSLEIDSQILLEKIINEFQKADLLKKEKDFIFTDKSLENFFFVELILGIFPNAKIINCERNIFESIISMFQNFLPNITWSHSLESILKYINNYIKIINILKKKYPNQIYSVNLDDIKNDSEKTTRQLFNYCELSWDPKSLEFYKRTDLTSKTASNIQIRNKIYKTDKNKYHHYKEFFKQYKNKYKWLEEIL